MRFKQTGLGILVLIMLITASIAGVAQEVPDNYRLAAQSAEISLYVDDATTYIAVQHNQTGDIWYSNPINSRTERDTLAIVYYNPSDEMKQMNNWKDSIEYGQYEIESIDNGIRVNYLFGQEWWDDDWLPLMVPQDRFENEILPKLSDKDADWLKSKYKLIGLEKVSEDNQRVSITQLPNQDQQFGDYVVVSPGTKLSDKDKSTLTLLLVDTVVAANNDLTERADLRLEHIEQLIDMPAYVIDNTIRPWDRTDIQNLMKSIDYTPFEIAKDHEANKIIPPKLNVEIFRISVEYVVEGDSLIVRIPMDLVYYPVQVEPNDRYITGVSSYFRPTNRSEVFDHFGQIGGTLVDFPLYSINVLPHFGASPTGKDGYILIPDGSGALIHTGVATGVQYARDVYGTDHTIAYGLAEHEFVERFDRYIKERLYMPVFGLREDNKAFFAIIEEGGGIARIKANTASNIIPHAKVSSEYVLIPFGNISLTETDRTEELARRARGQIKAYAKALPEEDIVIRYSFLVEEESTYVGMANRFQEHLVRKYGLEKLEPRTDIPFYLELVGAAPVRKSIMGIPRNVITSLTSFGEVQEIVGQLDDSGVKNIQLRYLGWREGGLIPGIPNRVRIEEKLGSREEFQDLVKFLQDRDVGFYPDVDFLNIYDTKYARVNLKRHVAQSLNRQPVWLIRDNLFQAFATAPGQLNNFIDSFMKDYQNLGISGLALGDLGTQINSDHNVNSTVSRADSLVINQDAMKRLNKEYGLELMINRANVYAVPYASHVVNIPLTANNYNIVGRSIPFYQMALHGYVNYTGTPLNHASDLDFAVLKSLETGAAPYFSWMYKEGTEVKGTEFDHLFPNYYGDWFELAVEIYDKMNAVLRQVQGQRIIGHEMLTENVYKTSYENGLSIIVNYNAEAVEFQGVEIEGTGFKLIREGEPNEAF